MSTVSILQSEEKERNRVRSSISDKLSHPSETPCDSLFSKEADQLFEQKPYPQQTEEPNETDNP